MTREYINEFKQNYCKLQKELKILEKKIKNARETIADSVRGSSSQFPYVARSIKIEGTSFKDSNKVKKLKKERDRVKNLINKMEKELEYKLLKIDDPEIRDYIYLYCVKGWSYERIAREKYQSGESNIRNSIKRYLERKNKWEKITT